MATRDESHDAEASLDTEAFVTCPYCGEQVSITLDPGGGTRQVYVEDCEVCCRPWQLHVSFEDRGHPRVIVEREDG